jgi:2-polyprenyl-3-methyl-5-hydroxy-6-metoxy-1,4-benzoquinol methylase
LFGERVLEFLADTPKDVLDVGAGAGILEQMDLRGEARWVCGIDPDPRVIENPHLDEGREGVAEAIPYPDESFDVIIANNVLEHVPDPKRMLGSAVGFRVSTQLIESRPEYMRVHALTYLVGWAYERAVNFIPILRSFRVILLVEMKKLDRVSTGV